MVSEEKYDELLRNFHNLKDQLEEIKRAIGVKSFHLGNDYFNSLTENLCLAVDADFTFIGRLSEGNRIQTLSFFGNGNHLENFSYILEGTPCRTIVGNEICTYKDNVSQKFPKDKGLSKMGIRGYSGVPLFDSKDNPIGLVVALFKKPIVNPVFTEILLSSYAQKASSEIEHQITSIKIGDLNRELIEKNEALKKSEAIQRKLNKRIELALRTGKAAWFEVSFPVGELNYNKKLVAAIGLKTDDIVTYDDFISRIYPEERSEISKSIKYFLAHGRGRFETNLRIKTVNQNYKWFKISGQKQEGTAKNKPTHFIGIIEDISNQLEVENEKIELEHNYHQLIRNFPNGSILLHDKDLKVKIAGGPNLGNWELLHEKVIGNSISEIFPDNLSRTISNACFNSLKSKETTYELEFNGNWHRIINIPNRNAEGDIIGGVVMTQDVTHEKHVARQLEIEKHRFQSLIETTNIVAWELDINTLNFTYLSPQIESLSGYKLADWKGFSFWESILHEEDREYAVNYCFTETEKGNNHNFEYRIITKDKEIRWIRDMVTVVQENGKPKYLRGFFVDITKQKESEIKKKESDEKFRKAFYTSPDSININKLDGTYIDINEGFTKILGYNRGEVVGKKSFEIGIWVNHSDRERLVEGLATDGFVTNLEAKFRKKNGQIVIGLMSASLINIENEPHILSITRDITERKRIQETLAESEKKYRYTFEAIKEGLWDWDVINNKSFFSESFYKMLDYELDEVENSQEAWAQLIHKDDVSAVKDAINIHMKGEKPDFSIEYRLKSKSGKYKWVKARGKIMEFTPDNQPKRLLAAIENIDSIKEAELELELSYTKYKTLADYTHDWEYWREPGGNYIYVSPSCEKISGYKPEEFLKDQDRFKSIILASDLTVFEDHEVDSMKRKKCCSEPIEFRIRTKAGGIIWMSHVCQPVYGADGNYLGNRGTNRDITLQKEANQKLLASESRYRLLFENMTSGFALHEMIYDEDGKPKDYRFLEINPAFESLTGLKKEKILGKTVKAVLPTTEEYWIEMYAEVAKTGKSKYYENYSQELDKYYSTYAFSPEKNKFAVIFHDITTKKQIEDDLIESENKLKLHLEQTPLGVIEWGLNSEILSWNKAAEKIFGYTYEEVKGKIGIVVLVPDHLQPGIKHVWEETLKRGSQRNTNENRTKDGRQIICDWYNTTIVDEKGDIIGVISMVEDVTEREHIQRELRQSEERHKIISRIASDYVYSFKISPDDGDLAFDWVAGGFSRITGYRVEEINHKKNKWKSIIHPDDLKKINAPSNKNTLPVSKTEQYRIVTKNGQVKWISDTHMPLFSSEGEIKSYVGSVTDITKRKLAEESLKSSEQRLKRLAEISEEGIIIINNQRIVEVNKAVSRITGYPKEKLLGFRINKLVLPADQSIFYNNLKENMDLPFVVQGIKKSGETYFMEIYTKPYIFEGRRCKVASIRDVSQRVQIEQELKRNEEYLNQAQKIAHIGHWHWDMVGDQFYCSDEFKNIYEINSVHLSFRELFFDYTHPQDIDAISELWENSDKTSLKYDDEFRILVNGRTKWIRCVAKAYGSINGEPTSMTGLLYDITNAKNAEIEIKKLNQAIEQSFACIVITDTLGNIEYANPRFYQLTGYTPKEVIGNNPRVLSAGTLSKDYYKKMWETLASGKTWQGEFHNKKKNGESFWESAIISPITNEDGEITHYIAVKDDITEKKRSDLQIQESNQKLIELNEQIANYKMMALRSVMNPHFIFNCLNSIQFYIAKNEKETAISYLSLFAKLMRNVLNSSMVRYVTLRNELDTLEYYVKLEKLRFDDNFDFILDIDEEVDLDFVEIPSMIIQPYIENAIVHGLANKYDAGTLLLKITADENSIICTIEDDGIGRKASMKIQQKLKRSHNSYAMTVTEERLSIINKTDNVEVEVIDLEKDGEPAGTRVIMNIGIHIK